MSGVTRFDPELPITTIKTAQVSLKMCKHSFDCKKLEFYQRKGSAKQEKEWIGGVRCDT